MKALFGQFASLPKADDVRNILCPPSPSFLLMATDQKRRKLCPPPDIEDPNPFRCMELVAGDGKHINGRFFEIERNLSGCLDRIRMERNPFSFYNLTNLFDRKDHSCLIVGIHDRNDCRLLCNRLSQFVQIQPSFSIHREFSDPVSLWPQEGWG